MLSEKLLKPYNSKETEERINKLWQDSGYFAPEAHPSWVDNPKTNPNFGKSFTIVMPPPNANGHLHAGHALAITLEDIMIRYKRMRGFKTLWIPGADHAGFETQIVYEKKLEKEGQSRFKMEPKELYKEILDFTLENKKFMEEEVRRLGASCDWSREKFTLDESVIKEVERTFKKMYDDGLVYRGPRIINWCAKHQTSLSDVETENKEKTDPFYYFKYGPFTIGTARPETKFGDKYVVMHPDDKRYAKYKHGEKLELEWINGPITATVIKDGAIDMEFGTGAMTITPWHDAIDFAISERHKLDREQIIDTRGKLLPIAGEFTGIKIADARPKIVEKLKAKGLLVKTEDKYVHNVPVCYKCETPIEPQILPQWFVKMAPLADLALKAVDENKITFHPDNFKKIFIHWMTHTIDWNISRQIVWGIKIPAKICEVCGDGVPDLENKIKKCPKCSGAVREDTDTFDTWFSSGQWPLLVLNYPDGQDFKKFYPTDVMETGYDLIFKWIPRMVIFGLYLSKQVPFKNVYLHGLVNDAHGKKMSKSKGNVVSPIILIDKYGTDALRMALIIGNTPGTDLALAETKINGYKHFMNKLWNIARFIFTVTEDIKYNADFEDWDLKDKALRNNRDLLLIEATKEIEDFKFYLAGEKLYHYSWHEVADKIIEESKEVFKSGSPYEQDSRKQLLLETLRKLLLVLHPFAPFITEELWSFSPFKSAGKDLLVERWPI